MAPSSEHMAKVVEAASRVIAYRACMHVLDSRYFDDFYDGLSDAYRRRSTPTPPISSIKAALATFIVSTLDGRDDMINGLMEGAGEDMAEQLQEFLAQIKGDTP